MYRVDRVRGAIGSGREGLVAVVACVGFWCSILLPLVHVPLLLAAGLTETTLPVLATLWGLDAVGTAVGVYHSPSTPYTGGQNG